MRIGRQAAHYYVTDDVIQKLVDQLVGTLRRIGDDRNVVSLVAVRRNRQSQ